MLDGELLKILRADRIARGCEDEGVCTASEEGDDAETEAARAAGDCERAKDECRRGGLYA